MNAKLSRTNALFAFTLSILAFLMFLCAMSTAFKSYSDLIDVNITVSTKTTVKSLIDYSAKKEQNDLGSLTFDLDGDFTHAFDWNTKQLFIFITANYATSKNFKNQIVLWDHIMLRDGETKLQLRNKPTKYYFWDDGKGLVGNNITLTMSINVIPNVGLLPLHTLKEKFHFAFPSKYTSS